MEKITIDEFKLPDGSIYTGDCIKNHSMIELSGEGEIFYPNGDKYIGHFENGNVRGSGKYVFSDGDIHHGEFFNGIPNGVGYLNKHDSMCMGNFKNGRLNGWALRLGDEFDFGWWKDGLLIKNETDKVEWAFSKIQNSSFKGNWVRILEFGNFEMGIPKVNKDGIIISFFGFLFSKEGQVSVGVHSNLLKDGPVAVFNSEGLISYAQYLVDYFLWDLTFSELLELHLQS